MAKTKKEKAAPVDGGLSVKEKKSLRDAIRQIWYRQSYARKLVVKRCLVEGGFSRCELCLEVCPKIAVDHTTPCGTLDSGFIERCFVSSDVLQGLCKRCHAAKTKQDKVREKTLSEKA